MADPHTFYLSSDPGRMADRKLVSYSGIAKGGKMVLTLKVEVAGYDIPYTLESLEAIQLAHSAKAKRTTVTPKQAAAYKHLLGVAPKDGEGQ